MFGDVNIVIIFELSNPFSLFYYIIGTLAKLKYIKEKSADFQRILVLYVELEGIEPSSKRGNHKLSTCLSLPKFSCRGRTKAINRDLIL